MLLVVILRRYGRCVSKSWDDKLSDRKGILLLEQRCERAYYQSSDNSLLGQEPPELLTEQLHLVSPIITPLWAGEFFEDGKEVLLDARSGRRHAWNGKEGEWRLRWSGGIQQLRLAGVIMNSFVLGSSTHM